MAGSTSFGALLKRYRQVAGLSQEALEGPNHCRSGYPSSLMRPGRGNFRPVLGYRTLAILEARTHPRPRCSG
jgi:hypothetical protein